LIKSVKYFLPVNVPTSLVIVHRWVVMYPVFY